MVAIASGFNYKTPRKLFPFARSQSVSAISNVAGSTQTDSAAAGFWTNLGNNGVAVDTNFVAATPKQVLSASGAGEILGIIGPVSGGTETTTFTFVLDGVTYTSPAFSVASGERAGLWFAYGTLAAYTTANAGLTGTTLDATKTIKTDGVFIPGWDAPIARNTPKLEFSLTAVISITHSANVTGTASQERQSGVGYRMLPVFT